MKIRLNKYAIIGLCVVAAFLAIFGIQEFFSYRNITFELHRDNISVNIYTDLQPEPLHSFSTTSTTRLKKGTYYYIANGSNVDDRKVSFTVGENDDTITIDPDFSSAYLKDLLVSEGPRIYQSLNTRYGAILNEYEIVNEQLHIKGEWASVKLAKKTNENEKPDIYRTILKEENDTWAIVVPPQLVINAGSYNTVPKRIVQAANSAASY